MHKAVIAASILSADWARLAEDAANMLAAGADALHFDVMDHHFVPNLSFGALPCAALRRAGIVAPIDVHLMVENPQNYVEPFAKAGATRLSFHPETTKAPLDLIKNIRQAGMQAGVVFNPDKKVEINPAWLESLDLILLMSVFPGFGGQKFIEAVLAKAAQTRRFLDTHSSNCYLAIDGGVKRHNIKSIAACGVDFFVAGSALFAAQDYAAEIKALRHEIQDGYANPCF